MWPTADAKREMPGNQFAERKVFKNDQRTRVQYLIGRQHRYLETCAIICCIAYVNIFLLGVLDMPARRHADVASCLERTLAEGSNY